MAPLTRLGSGMANIFISYRRDDAGGHAGRVCDRLTARFGSDRVFMDIQDIQPGQDFAQSIRDTIARCECVLAIIGPRWLESVRERSPGGEDFVVQEIVSALTRRITVIPVLVGGAGMPAAAQLPPALAALAHRNAVEIRDERFEDDVARLAEFLATTVAPVGGGGPAVTPVVVPVAASWNRRLWLTAACVALAVIVAAAGVTLFRIPGAVSPQALAPTEPVAAVGPAAVISGSWLAEMRKEGQPPFRIRLTLSQTGADVMGTVRYPTGDGQIHDGVLDGRTLTFYTSHTPQFDSAPAVIRFQAEIAGDEIRLTSSDANGLATGTARRDGAR